MEEKVKQEKLSYEDLERVAKEAAQTAEMWKQRAYEISQKVGRIELILNCLNMQNQYMKEEYELFSSVEVNRMAGELMDSLYPKTQEESNG